MEIGMKRFIEGEDRRQAMLLPDCLDDYVAENNPVRVVEVFIDELDLAALGFAGMVPEETAARRTIRRPCSRFTYTAISTASSRAGG
jgi:hypothetical protein